MKTNKVSKSSGAACHCKPGQQRDNCPDCEGTGRRIDFAAIRASRTAPAAPKATRGSYRTQDGKAQIEWELKAGSNGPEFSASGEHDGYSGQCIDHIAKAYPRDEMVQRIARVWEVYHLNGMNAGLPAQRVEIARQIDAAKLVHPEIVYSDGDVNFYKLADLLGLNGDKRPGGLGAGHYELCLHWLKAAGLYEIPLPEGAQATGGFPAEVVSGERGYRYGERWVYLPIPAEIIAEIESWSNAPQPRESLHEAKAKAFLVDNGLKLRATLSDTKPAPWGTGEYRPHFRVTLSRAKVKTVNDVYTADSRLSFDFWGAVDMREASAYTVLSCIASDIHTPETFEDFCSEFGEEEDSRKALQAFRRADRFARRLRAFFTAEETEVLAEIR